MEDKLRDFLTPYIGRGTRKADIVTQESVDLLVATAIEEHIGQEIIDYGTAHPEAPFWDFLNFIPEGLDDDDDGADLLDDDDE